MRPDTGDAPTPAVDRGSAAERRASPWLAGALVVVTVAFGLYRVFDLRWICDDAFISFRYAQNLASGHGLVFNAGERVEGYTNFLWTLLVALGMKLHLDPVLVTQVIGGASFALTVYMLAYLSVRLVGPDASRPRLFLPLAALALCVHHDFHVWATGGLETALVTALVVAGFGRLVSATNLRGHFVAGVLFTAAAMARPDALLFYLAALFYRLAEWNKSGRELLAFGLPLALIFAPYWLARYSYYGFFFPNTYYAKSAGLPAYRQGLAYLELYVRSYYILLLVPVAGVHLLWQRGRRLQRPGGDLRDRAAGLSLLFILTHTLYVVRVGGDFMFARFFIPVTPFAFLLLEMWLHRAVRSRGVWIGATLLIVAAVAARRDCFPAPRALIDGIASERDWYPEVWQQDRREFGRTLRRCLEGTETRLAFRGTHAATIYYAGLPYAVEADAGLTDTALARRPLAERGRPGHEKPADLDDLLKRRVHFLLRLPRTDPIPVDRLTEIRFGYRLAYMVRYDVELMKHVGQFDDVAFVDFPAYLDAFTSELARHTDSEVVEFYRFARGYYFDGSADSVRAAPFEARLARMEWAE